MKSHITLASTALVLLISIAGCDTRRDTATTNTDANQRTATTTTDTTGTPRSTTNSGTITGSNSAPNAAANPTPAPDNTARNKRDAPGDTKTPMDQSESPEHIKITADIRAAVMAMDGMSTNGKNIKIITDKAGVVTLRGVVASQSEKDKIDAKARSFAGVTSVVNQLEVNAG
jgi:hypothetical protein